MCKGELKYGNYETPEDLKGEQRNGGINDSTVNFENSVIKSEMANLFLVYLSLLSP